MFLQTSQKSENSTLPLTVQREANFTHCALTKQGGSGFTPYEPITAHVVGLSALSSHGGHESPQVCCCFCSQTESSEIWKYSRKFTHPNNSADR